MTEIKDENLNKYAQSSSDFTDDQTTTTLHLLPPYNLIYIYNKCKMKAYSLIVSCCNVTFTLLITVFTVMNETQVLI